MNEKQLFFKRFLAFFVDSLFGMAIFFAVSLPARFFDYSFVPAFLLMAVYFVVGNSSVTSGRTIGKRLFGLKCINQDGSFLSLGRSALRFCLTYGLFPLLAEVPPLIFRSQEVIASSFVLEANNLVWLLILSSSLAGILSDGHALHDKILGTLVTAEGAQIASKPKAKFHMMLGALLGALYWFTSVSMQTGEIYEHRYFLENKLNARLEIIHYQEFLEVTTYFMGKSVDPDALFELIKEKELVPEGVKKVVVKYYFRNNDKYESDHRTYEVI